MKKLLIVLFFTMALPSFAVKPVNASRITGVAIKGYDPVAYHTEQKPVKGSKDHAFEWKGATWRFASADHLAQFKAEPEKYAPQYGGWCAWAVSQNSTAGIDPDMWTIVDGKLYLNYSKKVQAKWLKDRDALIQKGNENWPGLLKK